jgi:electron transport complex protein RnfD
MTENVPPAAEPMKLCVMSSPHIRTPESVPRIMWTVNAVLAPVGLFAVYWFGWRALLTLCLCIGTAVLTEWAIERFRKMPSCCLDGSAFLTGLLFAYVMPANQPWYVSVIGSAFAISIGKHAFGGLGNNIWNPALVARAFVLAAWPAATILGAAWPLANQEATPVLFDLNSDQVRITAPSPLTDPEVSNVSEWRGAVDRNLRLSTGLPGTASAGQVYFRLLIGHRNGCLGETMGLLLILGGVFLWFKGYINWRVPLIFIATTLVLTFILPEKVRLMGGVTGFTPWFAGDPLRHLLGGGLLIGAFFMATDMVTSPVTNKGLVIFAVGCGLLTALIRLVGGYPEGVSYAIILMNTAVPLIDRFSRPRTYGEVDS